MSEPTIPPEERWLCPPNLHVLVNAVMLMIATSEPGSEFRRTAMAELLRQINGGAFDALPLFDFMVPPADADPVAWRRKMILWTIWKVIEEYVPNRRKAEEPVVPNNGETH